MTRHFDIAALACGPIDETVHVVGLSAGSQQDQGCIGLAQPRLRWKLAAARPAVLQRAAQVQVARDADFTDLVGASDPEISSFPVSEVWPAPALASRDVYWTRVRVWTDRGVTDWSQGLRIEAALLSSADWIARPISPAGNCDQALPAAVPHLRKSFRIDKPIAQARLYVTAQGVHESWLNGEKLSDIKLEPGWTAYQARLLYSVFDVTKHLRQGDNVLAAAVGDGWWRGWLTWMERRAVYGATTTYLAQLEITHVDGSKTVIATDDTWRGCAGEVLSADLYDGSVIDLRRQQPGWKTPGFDDSGWEAVRAFPLPVGLELRAMPPVRIVQRWSVIPRLVGPNRWLLDLGQNLAGYLRIRVSNAAGATITLRHAELLGDDGELHTAPLRNAKATDTFVLGEDGVAELEPAFTFHGFRYAEIAADGPIVVEHVEICALSTDMAQTGAFACSDWRLNKLFENVRWSQIGNFVALPTDCPQRDERLGWTGDIQVFADTACANADAGPFLASWLRDLAIEQRADGNVPSTAPNVIGGHEFEYGGVGWGDSATLVPWSVYQATGDASVLHAQFDSMRAWVDYCASRRDPDGVWTSDFQLGDWLDPGAPSDQPEKATTDSNFIATAYLSRSAAVLALTAERLGQTALAERYRALSREVAAAAWARWADHAITTQAGCAIALAFDIAPPDQAAEVGRALAALVNRNEGRIATGFLGTPLVLPALSATGQMDAAYRLLLNEDCPGWLFQVKHGATTTWERWDAVKPDGTLHAGEMSSGEGSSMISYNHYAYGAVALWLYQTVAGIAADGQAPGYARVRFAPRPGGGLSWAKASLETPFGSSAIGWAIQPDGSLVVDLEIAPGATGQFHAPAGWSLVATDGQTVSTLDLPSGRHRLALLAL